MSYSTSRSIEESISKERLYEKLLVIIIYIHGTTIFLIPDAVLIR